MSLINNYKLAVKTIVALVFATLFFVWSVNYIVDPYGKNHKYSFTGNVKKLVRDERISKFNLLESYPKASSFIFGSSRSLAIDAVKFGEYTNTEALNMGFSSASSSEYYLFIKYLLETRKVSNIIIGVDLFAYTKNFKSNGVMPRKLLSYFNLDNDSTLKDYVSFRMLVKSFYTLNKNYNGYELDDYYTPRGKMLKKNYLDIKDNKIKLNEYVKKNVVDDAPRWGSKSPMLSEDLLNNLVKINELCDENKVKLYLFMSPIRINQMTMKKNRFEQQKNLLRYIVTHVSPVYDFNGISSINIDPSSYMDSFHYSYDSADLILKEMFDKKIENNRKKGFLVTKNNMEGYLSTVDKKLNNYIRENK